jgi:hypothetical protein
VKLTQCQRAALDWPARRAVGKAELLGNRAAAAAAAAGARMAGVGRADHMRPCNTHSAEGPISYDRRRRHSSLAVTPHVLKATHFAQYCNDRA